MNKYFLGIDGGGTKTAFVVIDENNQIVYESIAGPTSIDTVPFDVTVNTILEATKSIPYKVDSVFAGIGGISSNDDIKKVNDILRKIIVLNDNCVVDSNNDVMNALYGGLGGDGIVLIAGTGSVAYGQYKGKNHRCGGYGYQEGDSGSSYDLGHNALRYLAKVIDGRKEGGLLAEALKKEINCYDFPSLAHYFVNSTRTEIAKLAKVVTKCEKDPFAQEIITNGVNEVLLMISTVYKSLEFKEKCYFTIIGSLGNADTMYRKLLLDGLSKISTNIEYIHIRNEASLGSALKAKDQYR